MFAEGIRRGLASHSHRRLRQRTVSVETVEPEHSPSGDSEEMVTSPKQSTINIMNNIKRKIMSKEIELETNFREVFTIMEKAPENFVDLCFQLYISHENIFL